MEKPRPYLGYLEARGPMVFMLTAVQPMATASSRSVMVLDIGGVLEFFGGIEIVVTVSLPSVALSTLSASWPNDISRDCLSFLVPHRVQESSR